MAARQSDTDTGTGTGTDTDIDTDTDADKFFFCTQIFCVYVLSACVFEWGTERRVRAMSEYL